MNNLSGKKAILYRRVSTTDQKTHGNSLNAQKDRLRGFCKEKGISIKKEFEEDFSAKNFKRPIIQELLEFAHKNKNEIDFLLITSWDRFSRNVFEAQSVISELSKIGIEVNSVENWIDYEDPNQLILHLLHLAMPEVDNRIRSQKVKTGIRQALKEGRWVHMQPKGYVSGKDELGKPLMKPHPEIAPLINELFNDFALGLYSQNELLTLPKYKLLKLSKSNLSRMLKQIAYAGKIRVPANKDEIEEVVDALHQPLITMDIFRKTQIQLTGRSRYKQKPKKINEYLPLRGQLQCSKCGDNLTGSGSKSKTGAIHYYYHCNPKKGCGERFKVSDAHLALDNYFDDLKPKEEVCDLLELILKDKFENSESSKKNLLRKNEEAIKKTEAKNKALLDKLLDGTINNETYKEAKTRFDEAIFALEIEQSELLEHDKDVMTFVSFGIHLFKNIKELFFKASATTKQKILSSILKEKLVFEKETYRTPKFNNGFEFIYHNIKKLNVVKQKNERLSYDNLPLSTEDGT
ncbi:recombinase family protein [Algibacter sp.]|nr:recombinase family protein [Algibacter sp.]MDA9069181.1 recombinase family protein [Algibacter sp.]MDC1365021.1 recombinase family protein [Algibacter sp.]